MPGHRRTRWLPAVGLLFLAPITAEYITAYDPETTGDPVALLGGLLILGPLYGAPALLIREAARRFDVHWPGLLAMAAALGLVQAGLVDQSLFSESYRDLEGWDETLLPTFIDPLGVGGYLAMVFVVGHTVWTLAIPIVLVEALTPRLAREPWLARPGLVIVTILYGAAAALVLGDHLNTEKDHASLGQMIVTVLLVLTLFGFAFTIGRREAPLRTDADVPPPCVVGVVSLVVAFGFNAVPTTWLGVAIGLAVLVVTVVVVARLSRSRRWDARHVVALAFGALVARVLVGFLSFPEGVGAAAKLAHNGVFLLAATALGMCAYRRSRPPRVSDRGVPMTGSSIGVDMARSRR